MLSSTRKHYNFRKKTLLNSNSFLSRKKSFFKLRGPYFNNFIKDYFYSFFKTNSLFRRMYLRSEVFEFFVKDSFIDCFFLSSLKFTKTKQIYFFDKSSVIFTLKSHYYIILELLTHLFTLKHYIDYKVQNNPTSKPTISLNYKRRNFFPFITSFKNEVFIFSSLGLFSKMFNKPKAFIRNKLLFLLTSSFFRKVLLFADIKYFNLKVKRKPIYLQEFINTLFAPSIALYKHPFTGDTISEKLIQNPFTVINYLFVNNKNFSYQKTRLKGRVKRRIGKRLVKMNNVLD